MSVRYVLDLCCGEGGAGNGYHLAGCQVVGVDIKNQPRYPFDFERGDAIEFLLKYGRDFDFIHTSPPCQRHTKAQRLRKNNHPDLIAPMREALRKVGRPYIIENVPGAPLEDPFTLCGTMFGIKTIRHREFELGLTSLSEEIPIHPSLCDDVVSVKMGRPVYSGEYIQVVGNFSNVAYAREVMGMPWASRDGLREAIPPVYTKWIAEHLVI